LGSEWNAPTDRLRVVYAALACGVVVLDTVGRVVEANAAAENLLGVPLERMRGQVLSDYIWQPRRPDGSVMPLTERPAMAALRTGRPQRNVTGQITRPDGSCRWLQIDAVPVSPTDGTPPHVVVSYIDVTERQEAQDASRANEERFRALTEHGNDLVSVVDATVAFRYVSPSYARVLGYEPGELIGQSGLTIVHPDDVPALAEALRDIAGAERTAPVTCRTRHKDGSWRTFDCTISNRSEDPAIQGWIFNSHDVTERTRAEEALRHSETRYRALAEHATDLVQVLDEGAVCRYASPSHLTILGYRPEDIEGKRVAEFVHPDDLRRLRAAFTWMDGIGEGSDGVATIQYRRRHADGSWRTLEAVVNNRLDDPAVRGVIVNSRDITERARTEEERRRRARHTALRADVSAALATSTTLQDMLQRCVDAAVRHFDAALTRIWLLDEKANALELRASAGLAGALDGPHLRIPVGHLRTGLIARDGRPYLTNDVASDPHIGADWVARQGLVAFAGYPFVTEGRVGGVLSLFARRPLDEGTLDALAAVVDMIAQGIERKRAEEALRRQALHDALTDLPNRVLLRDRLDGELRAIQHHQRPLALLLLDLDRFKEVNDTFGHQQGDLLLQEVARRLRDSLRDSDTVARLGGDEFAVLLPDTDARGAVAAAHKLCAALDAPVPIEGHLLHAEASVGIALCPEHGSDAATLLSHADVAMYTAKRQRSGCAVYDALHDPYSPRRLGLIGDLRRAIAQGALALHYQPKIEVATGRVRGVEALVRWPHPRQGLIPPDGFIPLAEETGLIAPLTHWVLDEALRQCHLWHGRGLDLGMAVNLSVWNLHDPTLLEAIARLLETYGVPPAALCLELTESAIMADTGRAVDALTRLRALGVRLAVDDFGTGYSSLAYLKRLPVDELKIDKSFVQRLAEDATDLTVVTSVVGLGHGLGLHVVAEGVENGAALELLARLGCDTAQGYHIGRPLPPDKLARLLRAASCTVA